MLLCTRLVQIKPIITELETFWQEIYQNRPNNVNNIKAVPFVPFAIFTEMTSVVTEFEQFFHLP